MPESELPNLREVRAYMENALESLEVAELNLKNNHYNARSFVDEVEQWLVRNHWR